MNAEWFAVSNDYRPTEKPESPTNFLVLRMTAIKNKPLGVVVLGTSSI